MKSYKHLFDIFISRENIEKAIKNSSKRKRKRPEVKYYFENIDKVIPEIVEYAKNYKGYKHKEKIVYEGSNNKMRKIIVPCYKEQILHHMIIQTLKPIIMKGMYYHSYGSIPKRGAHKCKRYIQKWIRKGHNIKYNLKYDIKQFFPSIDHEYLLKFIRKYIKDERFMVVIEEVLKVQSIGLPLGFYTSQWFANWYLQDVDHYIKEELGAVYYARYMDDGDIFGSNKRKLHKMKEKIEKYLWEKKHLKMKGNWQVFRFVYTDKSGKEKGRDLDYMGFRFFRSRTILRKKIMYKITRKAAKMGKKEKPTMYDNRQMLSYLGWIDSTDSYNMYLKWVKPHIKFQYIKRRISKYDRRELKNDLEKSKQQQFSKARTG